MADDPLPPAAMAADAALRRCLLAALRDDATLCRTLNHVSDGPPLRAHVPYAVIGDVAGSDWGTKMPPGRELIIAISLYDRDESAARIGMLAGEIGRVVAGLPRSFDGWQLASLVAVRSRLSRGAAPAERGPVGGLWLWQGEWRLRLLMNHFDES